MDEASGFFETPNNAQSPGQGTFELIGGSNESYCNIWRADKEGRFRVYKALKNEYVGDPVYERLLRKEFEIGYSLNHPNICEYYGFVNIPRLGNCIEMEWIDGCSLDNLLPRGVIGKALAAKIINETCDALAYMHSKQVVHRDLKPSNIMLTYNGNNVKIIDFGLSDSDTHSVLKGSAGTRLYASPELIEGGSVDFHTDIFSLGCVIDRLSPAYAKVARKCCRRDPRRRFQSAQEIKLAIARKSKAPFVAVAAVVAALGVASILSLPSYREGGVRDRTTSQADTIGVPAGNDSLAIQDNVASVRERNAAAPVAESFRKADESVRKASGSDTAPRSSETSGGHSGKHSGKKASHNDQEAIDELFRQATELFDQ